MRAAFSSRLEGRDWTAKDRNRARDEIESWVEAEYPFAERGPGVSVRLDDHEPDHRHQDPNRRDYWWRYTIGHTIGQGDVLTTVLTLSSRADTTIFEARLSVVPGGVRVSPRPESVSVVAVRALVRQLVAACPFFDAGRRVVDHSIRIIDGAGAQDVAAFCEAPSRTLPVVIETIQAKTSSIFGADRLPLTLSGLAHVYLFEGDAARNEFNSFHGADLLVPRGLTVVWPDLTHRTWNGAGLTTTGGDDVRRQCIPLITETAADSLAPLRPPLFRRSRFEERANIGDSSANLAQESSDLTADPENVPWTDYRSALDGWQEAMERIDQLEEAMAEADRLIAEKQTLLDQGDRIVDQLILQNTELALLMGRQPAGLVATNALDAVKQAQELCENLTFHPRSLETAASLDGIDANRLLQDLVRLNVVAGDWQTGQINRASLKISCRGIGLDFAAGISDTAEFKYGSEYAFSWRGRIEYAVAHIRNGKGTRLYRVHLFFDDETRQVVVAYIGRHLRGKRG